jgi:mitotic spindle assembly checkpoint protein MAD2
MRVSAVRDDDDERRRRGTTTMATGMAQSSKNAITLKGSTELVTEFFGYAVNNILYQRGVYPPEEFERKHKYGLGLMVTTEEKLKEYLVQVLEQINAWLMSKDLQKLVLVLTNVQTKETVERWVFDVQTDAEITAESEGKDKSEKEIMGEIQAIIRQITASVTFLPLLEGECAFELLAYTGKESATPSEWEESDPKFVRDSVEMKLRSFSTKVHSVDASVSYKTEGDE